MRTKQKYMVPSAVRVAVMPECVLAAASDPTYPSIKVDPDTGDELTPGGSGDAGDEGLAKPNLWVWED